MILISDVLGIESLVDSMAQERYQKFLQPKNVPTLADESAADMTCVFSICIFLRSHAYW